MRRARSFIRRTVAAMGPIERKAVVLESHSIPARSASIYDNPTTVGLLVCQETVNEETESDGTNVAEAPLYSKVVGMKMQLMLHGMSANQIVRWMLVKDVDNEGAVTNLTDTFFHNTNDTPTDRELRARTLAKGFVIGTDKTGQRLNLFIRRNTLKRLGNLRENDRLELILASSTSDTGAKLTGFGTIYIRAN